MSFLPKILLKSALIVLVLMTFSGCTQTAKAPVTQDGQLLVLVSAPPYVEFVNEIGKEFAAGWSVISENDDPATVQFSDEQIKKFASANLYLRTKNFPFEDALLTRLIEANPGLKVITLTDNLNLPLPAIGDSHYYHLAPNMAIDLIRKVTEALVAVDAENGRPYVLNENDYVYKVAEKNAYLATALSDKSIKKISSIDSKFAYFAFNYTLKYLNLGAPSEEQIDLLFLGSKNVSPEIASRAKFLLQVNPLQKSYLKMLEELIEKINKLE